MSTKIFIDDKLGNGYFDRDRLRGLSPYGDQLYIRVRGTFLSKEFFNPLTGFTRILARESLKENRFGQFFNPSILYNLKNYIKSYGIKYELAPSSGILFEKSIILNVIPRLLSFQRSVTKKEISRMPRKTVTRTYVRPVNLNIVEDDTEMTVPIILEQLEDSNETRRHTVPVVSKKGLVWAFRNT